ncbi:pentatricopeptide repeat-containing protein At3g49240, mitochondrial [Impatiens glandulifera]|uniref:pentatricopeptide repeat-containing protein At3g49240, mitochondrial n=1 Tax=Impatiens glandulifera TaxID=253017 RepID=UPI001FB0ADF9|nr:pentatricopeptide repeat-containing protein At3g49240, mitochondrial [Impatiens glandulifera]
MALCKSSLFTHLKAFTRPCQCFRRRFPPSFVSLRLLSFATPEEAAAERRRRKRRLRIEPPLSPNRPQPQQQPRAPQQNPNAPKIPENVSVLTGKRLDLHNKILTLIRENDLEEAALYTRHSVYSNCRPTIFTCNAVMAAQLRQSKYADLLSLHRFITQAGIAANVVTYNLLMSAYMDCRKTDTAMEHYKQMTNDAPFNPSPTTYRILIKGLVDNNKVERAMDLKDEMLAKGLDSDPLVYSYLMSGQAKNSNVDAIFSLYEELKEKLGDSVTDGVVYGSLMKGYFMKNMEDEAMECYSTAVGETSNVKMSAVAFNNVLDALCKNGKFDIALNVFDKMLREHEPPKRLTVNLGSFNVMVDGYCSERRFKEAIEVFINMGDKRCRPDTLSYNNLIEHLCGNNMLVEAEELYKGMSEKGVNPDEVTFVLLMDTCFKENRPDDAAGYFRTMVDSKLRPNLAVYNRLIDGLVKVGKIDEAKSFYDLMAGKLKMDDSSYEFLMKAMFNAGKSDEVLEMVGGILRDEGVDISDELRSFIEGELKEGGKDEHALGKMIEEVEREKAEAAAMEVEAAEKAKASARAAVASLLPSKLFGKKEGEEEENIEKTSSDDETETTKEDIVGEISDSTKG